MYNVANYFSWDKQNKQGINDEETFSNSWVIYNTQQRPVLAHSADP
jgi:hypothetical protein